MQCVCFEQTFKEKQGSDGPHRLVVPASLDIYQNLDESRGFPLDTGLALNVHKSFKRRPGRLLNVLSTFNLPTVSRGLQNEKYTAEFRRTQKIRQTIVVQKISSRSWWHEKHTKYFGKTRNMLQNLEGLKAPALS